jgi:diguanylate cyclase (GGDEF)-like protein
VPIACLMASSEIQTARIAQLPLTAKLTAISVLLAASLVAIVAVAWRHLPSGEEALAVAQLGRAQRATQNADMLHDALRSDVLTALLSADQPEKAGESIRRAIHEDAEQFRAELIMLDGMDLDPDIKQHLAAARSAGTDYVGLAEELVHATLNDSLHSAEQKRSFDTAFESTKQALAAQTALISSKLDAANARTKQATQDARRWLLVATMLVVCGGWMGVALVARSIRRSLMSISDVAMAVAGGDLQRRSKHRSGDEVGKIANSVNQMADALSKMIEQMRSDASRTAFGAQLTAALDMADSEKHAAVIAAQAMEQVSAEHTMELLLADSSDAHLERAAQHPVTGAAGCGVDSPYSCIAVRRGHPVHFDNSKALDACPMLQGRCSTAVAASCVPVSFMGRALGVLHACGPAELPLTADHRDRLRTLGTQVGSRIGTVRAFERTQIQASTDALTGLPNRRSVEDHVRNLMRSNQPFALVLADLDHFKLLNDTHGHRAGDDALRIFSDVVRDATRQQDIAGRWGGEEFCFVLTGSDVDHALKWVERLRANLATELRRRNAPSFTASFGATDSQRRLPLESMISAADKALYRAKSAGRDRSVKAVPEDLDDSARMLRVAEQNAELNLHLMIDRA